MNFWSPRADRRWTAALVAAFVLFWFGGAWRQPPAFDACYNLLSWQNLALGKGFVYDYNEQLLPFDPTISTGATLYLPVYLLWRMLDATPYEAALVIMGGYWSAFLVGIFFIVLRDRWRLPAALLFWVLILARAPFFEGTAFFDTPLGEPLAVMLMVAGLYLAVAHRRWWLGLLVVGLAVEVKTNVAVALLPTLALAWWREAPAASWRARGLVGAASVAIVLLPHAFAQRIVPRLALDEPQQIVWATAYAQRQAYVADRGFGHIAALTDPAQGRSRYMARLGEKIDLAAGYFAGSRALLAGYLVLLVAAALWAWCQREWTFYLFAFALGVYGWWFLLLEQAWYRYWSSGDFAVVVALTVLAAGGRYPSAETAARGVEERGRAFSALLIALMLAVTVPSFSGATLLRHFDATERRDLRAMARDLAAFEREAVFTYGWFQAPQLMLLTRQRFLSLQDRARLERAAAAGAPLYFLQTGENRLIQTEMDALAPYVTPAIVHGYARLSRIADVAGLRRALNARPAP